MTEYSSSIGRILISCDGSAITGLWFEGQKNVPATSSYEQEDSETLSLARKWLDEYFSGREPSFSIPVKPSGTAFQRKVWDILTTIPYGAVMTYIPCHRVIGSDGTLTGYAGGLERKRYLLELEGVRV